MKQGKTIFIVAIIAALSLSSCVGGEELSKESKLDDSLSYCQQFEAYNDGSYDECIVNELGLIFKLIEENE